MSRAAAKVVDILEPRTGAPAVSVGRLRNIYRVLERKRQVDPEFADFLNHALAAHRIFNRLGSGERSPDWCRLRRRR